MNGDARDLGEWTCTFPGCTSPPRHEHVFTPSELAAHDAAIRAEGFRQAKRQKSCGCGWCCAGVEPEDRGETHQRTCQPKPAALRAAQPTEGES